MNGAVIASVRFGFAARGDDLRTIGRDPQGWALAQLDRPPAPLAASLPGSDYGVARTLEARRERREAKRAGQSDAAPGGDPMKAELRQLYLAEIGARFQAAIESDAPLLERLTHFWSNHFTVSMLRPVVRGFAGAFEREAIRPHVTGRFADMLRAVAHHPAMLFYLDNVASIGPDSRAGRRLGKGLNENLARELLELHTLGVDGGYTQADVIAFAKILTGWTIARLQDPEPGRFRFAPAVHEPGAKTLLGALYREAGENEGEAALLALARHPATARHVAAKLARHFIADDPPPAAVERIAWVFRETDGDLRRVTAAAIASPEAWERPFGKIRTPAELMIAACRIAGLLPSAQGVAAGLRALDQMPFLAPSPAGWPDDSRSWISPEAVVRRAEWAQAFADRLPDPPDPVEAAAAAFGDDFPEDALQAIRRAPSRRAGLALLIASPEFQRR